MNRIEQIANEMRFNYETNAASGKYNGFRFTLQPRTSRVNNQYITKILVFPIDDITQYQINSLNEFFKKNKKSLSLFSHGYDGGVYIFNIIEKFKQINSEKFESMLITITKAFLENEVKTMSKCVFCKSDEEPNIEARVNNITFPAHQECYEKVKAEEANRAEEYANKENNYPAGIVGAIIGAALGMIPWLLLEIFTGFYAAILAILIGYLSFFFYKKFGGKVTTITKFIITITTFIAILLCNVCVAAYIIIQWDGLLILDNFIILYNDPEVGSYLLQSLLISVVIGGIGLFNVYKKVQSEEYTNVVD